VIGLLKHLQHAPGKTTIMVGILERVTDEFGRVTWQPQMEGGKAARELPGIVDQVVSMGLFQREGDAWRHEPERGSERRLVCRGGMRFLRFRAWLTEVTHLAGELSQIAFEEVRAHAGTDAAHLYGGFLAHLSAWCEERAIAYQGVPVGTIKRYATGKGNADKAAMIAAMRARGFAPADDNEADALALLLWATDAEGGRA